MNHLFKYLIAGMAVLALTACEPGKLQRANCNGGPASSGSGQGVGLEGDQGTGLGGAVKVVCGSETFTAAGAGDLIWILDCKPVATGSEYVYTPAETTIFQQQNNGNGKPGFNLKRRFHRLVAYDSVTFEKVDAWFIWDGGRKCDASGDGTIPTTDDTTATSTDDGASPMTDDTTATATDDGTATATDDGTATSTDDGTETVTDDGTATSTDDGTETVTDDTTATATDDGTETVTDDTTATATDDGTTTVTDDGTATATDDGTTTATDDGAAAGGYRARIEELYNKYIPLFPEITLTMADIETMAETAGVDLDTFDPDAWAADNGYSDLDNLTKDQVSECVKLLFQQFSAQAS